MNSRSFSLVLLPIMWIGCALVPPPRGTEADPSSGRVRDYTSLIVCLRQSGLRVEAAGEVQQPFFTPKAKVIRLGDSGLAQIYEYATEKQGAAEAARLNSDGSIEPSLPMWIAPPQFFRKRSLIVLFLGSDENTLLTLRGRIGNRFAGLWRARELEPKRGPT